MLKATKTEIAALCFFAGLVWGGIGAGIGYTVGKAKGRELERLETRTYVNKGMREAGFCGGEVLGSLVQSCLKEGKY